MTRKRIVILGNGGAAINAAISARRAKFSGEILIISDSMNPVFNPMLSPYYLKGLIPWERCFPFDHRVYGELDIKCHFGMAVTDLDGIKQEVTLEDGTRFSYDRCLIATGASPLIPPIEGLKDLRVCRTLRTPASVLDLDRAMHPGEKAIVLGASLVGIKVSEVLVKKGVRVMLIDAERQILPYGAHYVIADILKDFLEKHGIEVHLGLTIRCVEPLNGRVVCHFEDRMEVADILVICTGVRANINFVNPEQIFTEKAVIVDKYMATNMENVYAAGDACEIQDFLSKKYMWFGTWGFASKTGTIAGKNMAGDCVLAPDFIMENITPIFDWIYAQIGQIKGNRGDASWEYFVNEKSERHSLFILHNDTVLGANLINTTHLAGMVKQAIYKKIPFSSLLQALTVS